MAENQEEQRERIELCPQCGSHRVAWNCPKCIAANARREMQERCAEVADEFDWIYEAHKIAAAIRALGDTSGGGP